MLAEQAAARSREGAADGRAYFRLAHIAHRENRVPDAIEALRKATELDPQNAEYRYNLGRSYKAVESSELAEQAYREALRLRPDYTDAWISLGILLRGCGRAVEAEQCQIEALRIDPNNLLARLNLGNALLSQNKLAEAGDVAQAAQARLAETAQCFREVLKQNPLCAEAHHNLGTVLLLQKQKAESLAHLREALDLNPTYFEAAESLGRGLYAAGELDEAADVLSVACRLRPDSIDARLKYASALRSAHRFEAAAAQFERVLRQEPQCARAKGGLAATLADRGQYTKPHALFEQALAIEPNDALIQFSYSMLLLRNGEFEKAWDYYESRWFAGMETRPLHAFTPPQWLGESLEGKTLLIVCEQGIGDEIMFSSVFPEVMRAARHCIIECDERLEPLFRRSFPDATYFGVSRASTDWFTTIERNLDKLPPFDCWTPAGSMQRFLRKDSASFPKHAGYLAADAARTEHWRERLRELGPGLKVGISWRGGTTLSWKSKRSVTLEQLRPLLSVRGVQFVNLQYDATPEELEEFAAGSGISITHWPEAIANYEDTAALVCAVDLVISVCTAVVHLSGALGQTAWVMAPFVAEWRYGREGPDMIWYPSVRMFRQQKADAWAPVIGDVRRALQKRA